MNSADEELEFGEKTNSGKLVFGWWNEKTSNSMYDRTEEKNIIIESGVILVNNNNKIRNDLIKLILYMYIHFSLFLELNFFFYCLKVIFMVIK